MLKQSTREDVFVQIVREIDEAGSADTSNDDLNDLGESGDDPAPDSIESATPRRKRWLTRIGAGLAALLFLAAATAAGALGWEVIQQNNIAAAGKAASAAATAYATTLTTVDYQKIDQNFGQVLDGATGEFKNMYSQSSAQLRQLLIDNKAVSHGSVVDTAIKSATKDTVDVLVFVDQSITNSIVPQPRIDRSRISMTMQRIDGRWLAAKVDIK
ncbi:MULTISPECIES: hypothetical protein [unclassified Mycobacterium]|uniref:hypothetical protein n=1 Tax=unclassified Mycobacterium TaxID=2642494 RepID=UPI00055EE1C1|nr:MULTISPECIES: hypothetical protein [unclassified Mycobacterium]SEA60628.1 Mce-associated membrane protein [Mycobacterium sp. 283mftsu]